MDSTSVIASLITAAVAIIGITLTSLFSFLQRRDVIRNSERVSLQEAARQLTSPEVTKRAVGMAITSQYAAGSRVRETARQVLLSSLHLERSPFIVYRGLE